MYPVPKKFLENFLSVKKNDTPLQTLNDVREGASRPSTGHKCAETIYVHHEACQSDLSGVYTCHAENHDRRIQTQDFPSMELHFPNAKILIVIVKCEIPNK